MSGYNAEFGDLNFGSGIFANLGRLDISGITWVNVCPVISDWKSLLANKELWGNQAAIMSAWSKEDIDDTAWSNQAPNIDTWTKIDSDIIDSTRCRRD